MLEKVTHRCDKPHSPSSEQISLVGSNSKRVLVRCKRHGVERIGVHFNLPNVKVHKLWVSGSGGDYLIGQKIRPTKL